jgi:hypothetical protein
MLSVVSRLHSHEEIFFMLKRHVNRLPDLVYVLICAAALSIGGMQPAWAQSVNSGEQVYTEVCSSCHDAGVGKADLGLEEFARAVAHMGRAAGAKWKDPDAAMLTRLKAAEKKRLDKLKSKK